MTGRARILVAAACIALMLPAARAVAQAEKPRETDAPGAINAPLPDPLPGLPHPPDQPASLYRLPSQPPATGQLISVTPCEFDPLLDREHLPPPGWFSDLEVGIIKAHFKNQLVNSVLIPTPAGLVTNTVQTPSAPLDWTAAPRVQVGYRLAGGLGEFAVAWRGFATQGTQSGWGPDGPTFIKSRLDYNVADFDYQSWEISCWPEWDMRWTVGGRLAYLYYDSSQAQSAAQASAGSGILDTRVTNSYVGFGPHVALELSRKLAGTGLAGLIRWDSGIELGRIRQGFFEDLAGVDAAGRPLGGTTRVSSSQSDPWTNIQAGLSWQPPGWLDVHLFLGYEYEYWWNVGRLSITPSRGEMSNQGAVLRAEFNY